ncbi:transcriptional regulator [Streptomyces sp. G45]|uniref:transcriptional regulator n=1 Tax=Streptomyces sp. G45 TaxID=3406627 RepID=UPI003C27837F
MDELIELGRDDMDPSRRGVLGASLFSVALTVPHWQDVVGRAVALEKGTTHRIGMADVDMVTAMTERISDLDDEFGGRYARPMGSNFLVNVVAPALRTDGAESVRDAMRSAAADLCYLIGYMAVDEGLHGTAQRYYLKALELAGAANDHLTYCTTLRGMSVQAVDLRHSREAVRLADAAAAAAPQAGPRMRAFLAGQQAHAAAQAGDTSAAKRFIRDAETAMERAESRGKALGSYDPSSLHYHVSQVRWELGDTAGAVEAMVLSDRTRHSVYQRSRVHRRGLLAERQLHLGHLEAACETWRLALEDYPKVKSGRADERMRRIFTLLRPHLKNSTARDLYEYAHAVVPERLRVQHG